MFLWAIMRLIDQGTPLSSSFSCKMHFSVALEKQNLPKLQVGPILRCLDSQRDEEKSCSKRKRKKEIIKERKKAFFVKIKKDVKEG